MGGGVPKEGYTNRQLHIVAVCTTNMILSTSVVVLRLFVKYRTVANLGWDDGVAVLALVSDHLMLPETQSCMMVQTFTDVFV